jgi:membrane-bound serine protease (ClpP class)
MTKEDRTTKLRAWLIVLAALLDDIVVLALIFLILWWFNIKIPVWVIIIIGLILGTIVFIAHRAVVPSLRRRKVTGGEGMIGMTGRVTAALKPSGTVLIKDEYWRAKSIEGNIEIDDEVEVTGIKGLNLEVRKKGHE